MDSVFLQITDQMQIISNNILSFYVNGELQSISPPVKMLVLFFFTLQILFPALQFEWKFVLKNKHECLLLDFSLFCSVKTWWSCYIQHDLRMVLDDHLSSEICFFFLKHFFFKPWCTSLNICCKIPLFDFFFKSKTLKLWFTI